MAADDKKYGNVCDCGCGMGGRHWAFFLLRTLVTILILMLVFWFGLEVGRMSGSYERGGPMMRYGYTPMGVYNSGGGAMPMMQINGATTTPAAGGVQNY